MRHVVLVLGVLLALLIITYVIADRVYAPVPDNGEIVVPVEEPASSHPLIRVSSPRANEAISSPLTVTGEARGTWFFEATFPIVVVDWDGRIIGEGYAQAQSDWMTEAFVPFSGTVIFSHPSYGERGAVILQKSNPSGLPERDDAIEIPITFTQ